jgi:2-octaprenyl-6-methoxyphenol hydroxylase
VWVEEPAAAEHIAGLDDAAFAALVETRLQGVLGAVGDVGPRALHQLVGLRARRMAGPRLALVGEAAHVVPPVGAQGLNLGLRDAAQLADCAAAAKAGGGDIGGTGVLEAYERARGWDALGRSVSIDLLNRSLLSDLLPVDMLRGLAAHLAAAFAPLRRILMQEGMGLAGPLPSLMRDGEW